MNDAEQIQITGGWRVRDAMANTGRPRETYAALRLVQLQPCTAQSAAQAHCCFPVGTEGRRRARGDPEHVAPSSDRSSKEPRMKVRGSRHPPAGSTSTVAKTRSIS